MDNDVPTAGGALPRAQPPHSMWPYVRNPIARTAVKTAFEMLPDNTVRGPAFDIPHCPQEVVDYQMGLRRKLECSGIAERLPGGLGEFPDIYASLPKLSLGVALLFKPRNYKQLTQHIALNLEWYLSPEQPAVKLIRLTTGRVIFLAWVAIVFGFGLAVSLPEAGLGIFVVGGVAISLYGLLLNLRALFDSATEIRRANHAEFYRYLKESYSDPD